MLRLIIEILEFQKIGVSENVDIAKGKYKYPKTFNEFKKAAKWQLLKK